MGEESPEARAQRDPIGADAGGAAQSQAHQAGLVVQGHAGLIGGAHGPFRAGVRIGLGGQFAARFVGQPLGSLSIPTRRSRRFYWGRYRGEVRRS